ncbi:CLUMA_CG000339, isoform A [Clunio marinus]|uniref:CLUMA_CG000339, isoform A n=1 Tax=Clunio marinus TaxID=568069 RepID=A0A1J1HJS4_9DIPT|nr:CLUMA_CG000339, isoform A [Clunio marinus]
MTKIPKITSDGSKSESEQVEVISTNNNRKVSQLANEIRAWGTFLLMNNYKNQKPILEKRRRDRINSSLDELKSILLAIKQRDVSFIVD